MRSSGAALFNLARLLDERGEDEEALELYEQLEAMVDATQIEAGARSTCAILEGGGVTCWGDPSGGRLGRTTGTPDVHAVVEVSGAVDLAAGSGHTCAIDASGVICWGANTAEQVAPGSTASALPTRITLRATPTAVAAGDDFTCALVDGEVFCWGSNADRQLGRTELGTIASTGAEAIPGLTNVTDIVAGARHACARDNGVYWCWGANDRGQIRPGEAHPLPPTRIEVDAATVGLLDAGGDVTCARTDTDLHCWGDDNAGQLGGPLGAPQPVTPAFGGETGAFEVGPNSSCAQVGQELYCWGDDRWGQLGAGSLIRGPERVAGVEARQVAVGAQFVCAVDGSSAVSCFGRGGRGQLGNGERSSTSSPRSVMVPNVIELVAGSAHVCARTADGWLACWGAGGDSRLATGNSDDALTPTAPSRSIAADIVSLGAGGTHTAIAVDDAGTHAWYAAGSNLFAQLGEPTAVTSVSTFLNQNVLPADPIPPVIGAGDHHTCLLYQREVSCWGRSQLGQAGTTQMFNELPTTVVSGSVTALALGNQTSCAIQNDALWCWGADPDEMIGAAGESTPTPVQVRESMVAVVAVGRNHLCFIDIDGQAFCRGSNREGQLGAAVTAPSAAVPVDTDASFVDLDVGDEVSCGVTTLDELYCWGRDEHGALGSGRPLFSATPRRVVF